MPEPYQQAYEGCLTGLRGPARCNSRAGFGLPEEPIMSKPLACIIVIASLCLLTIPFLVAADVRMDSVALSGKSVPNRALVNP